MNPLTQIERALQSSNLSDHLSAIAQCSKAIRENPFPLFVNALLLRLADTFNGEKLTKMDHSLNLIRLRIVKLLRECGMDLAVVFSKDEIVRRVMKVSHSNDYKSRALTMLFFAAAAPIVHSNKKVHHLLVEGADCTDLTELTAAIVSVGHLGKFSAEFSSLIVEKIGEMVSETQTEESLKVRLMDDLSLFQENVIVTKQCMELGRSLLRNNPDQNVSLVVLNALTELAKRNGLALNDQIDLLLTEMPQFLKSRHFTRSFLANLARLADYPQHWTKDQVQMLQRILPFLIHSEFHENLVLWLDCMNVLAQRIHSTTISDSIPTLMELLHNSKFIIRIRTLQLLLTLAGKTSLPAEKLATIEEIKPLLGSQIINLMEEISESPRITRKMEKVRFFKSIVKLMRNGACSSYGLDEMSIIEVLQRAVESRHPEYYRQSLETLNAIADAIPGTATELTKWALERLEATKEGQFHSQSGLLYNLALLPIKENQGKILELTEKIVSEVRRNEEHIWFAYTFARTGFRYGHWSEVALPTLELMQEKCQTVESSAFISALINIAGAQLPAEINVQSLKNARQTLRHALLLLTPLAKNSRNTHCFTFPAAYINAIYRLFGATSTVLVAMNTLLDSNPQTSGIAHIEYVLPDIEQAREEFIEVREAWIELYQRSFDADSNTLNQLELMNRHAQLCELLLDRLYSQELTPISQFPRCAENCTNAQLEHLLDWAITKANQCFVPVIGSISQRLSAWASNLKVFDDIFGRLAIPSLCLPRFFFQQLWRTNIRVNILPQPREHEQYLQLTSRQLPLTVEGIIESNNPKGIQSMEIDVYMKVDKSSEEVLVDKRKTNLNAETYFKEQFLLTIRKMTVITVKLYFTDANSELKKLWRAESEGRLVVNIPEFKDNI